RSSVLVATFTYVILFATPLIEGNIANAENFMHLPILLCAIFILKSIDEKKAKFSLIAGGLMSVAFILKIVAVFEFTAFMLFLLFVNRSRITINLSILSLDKFKREILFFIGFLSLPFLFSI